MWPCPSHWTPWSSRPFSAQTSDAFLSQSARFSSLCMVWPKLPLSLYFLPLSNFVILLQPHWLPWYSSSKLSKFMLQDSCIVVLSVWNTFSTDIHAAYSLILFRALLKCPFNRGVPDIILCPLCFLHFLHSTINTWHCVCVCMYCLSLH